MVLLCVLLLISIFLFFYPRFVKKEEESTAPSSCVYCTISRLIWKDLLDIWRKWWRNEDYFLLFWSITGASSDMVAKQFKCRRCPYLIYFSNTNLLDESVLIWTKMCWMFFGPQDTVGTGFYFGSCIFYHTVLLKETIFTLNSIENWDAKPHYVEL